MLRNDIKRILGGVFLVGVIGSASATPHVEKFSPPLSPDLIVPDVSKNDTLWDRIRGGFRIKKSLSHPLVQEKLRAYRRHPKTMVRTLKRATPFLYYLVQEIEKRKFPLELVFLPVVESAYNPYVNSIHNAAGIWQIIPRTAEYLGLKRNIWYEGRRDIHASTKAALDYLGYLHKRFNNDWMLAIAAYNVGEGVVERAIRENKIKGASTEFWALNLTSIPRNYVAALLAFSELVAYPTKYAVRLEPIPNRPYLAKVNLKNQVELGWVAHITKLTHEEIYFLNPGLNQGATPPGAHHLLLPIPKAKELEVALNQRKAFSTPNHLARGKRHLKNPFVFQQAKNISDLENPA
ncbi:MAG: transglycosylase SLT domain-containing protein [Gammaproteobacteria bacterium]|nr:transglycosylase SLT domain-containing protein [Gammaproteobacteria bacterium]